MLIKLLPRWNVLSAHIEICADSFLFLHALRWLALRLTINFTPPILINSIISGVILLYPYLQPSCILVVSSLLQYAIMFLLVLLYLLHRLQVVMPYCVYCLFQVLVHLITLWRILSSLSSSSFRLLIFFIPQPYLTNILSNVFNVV